MIINRGRFSNGNTTTYQRHCCVVDVLVVLGDWDLFNAECNSLEAELSCDVHATQLHIHGNHLHRPDPPTTDTPYLVMSKLMWFIKNNSKLKLHCQQVEPLHRRALYWPVVCIGLCHYLSFFKWKKWIKNEKKMNKKSI